MRFWVKHSRVSMGLILALGLASPVHAGEAKAPEKRFETSGGLALSVKQIGPVTQTTELQILCILKHESGQDRYLEAMQDFNDKQGGLLSALRERGEFVGELGETFLYTPPPRSITPKRVLLIGVGEAQGLSLERLRLVGRIALREAVRLEVKHVSFAPTLRDQGSEVLDVGEGDGAVVEQLLLALDTEQRLRRQGLAPRLQLSTWVIEAGPKYFEGVVAHVGEAIRAADERIQRREGAPYVGAAPAAVK